MTDNQREHYIGLYKQLHSKDKYYGTTSIRWLPFVQHYVDDLEPKSILDFGCGKSNLLDRIRTGQDTALYRSDPAIPEYSTPPEEVVDMVLNIDVMEHIPESAVDETLQSIRSLSEKVFFNINCQLAWNTLPDGSNAHCTVYPPEWWRQKLEKYFGHVEEVESGSPKSAIFVTWPSKSHYVLKHKLLRKVRHHLTNVVCLFVPVRSWRRYIRDVMGNT
jgi:hypothetical protein